MPRYCPETLPSYANIIAERGLCRYNTTIMNSVPEAPSMDFLFVAMGGALGAVLRYAISLIPAKNTFPVLTLITNVLGAVLIGFIVGLVSDRENVSAYSVLFWKTGVCGGFTTFSTFSLEAYGLFENNDYLNGSIYVVLSVSLCLAGIFLGKKLAALMESGLSVPA